VGEAQREEARAAHVQRVAVGRAPVGRLERGSLRPLQQREPDDERGRPGHQKQEQRERRVVAQIGLTPAAGAHAARRDLPDPPRRRVEEARGPQAARDTSVIVSRPCSSPANSYVMPGRSTGSGGNGLSVENALSPASTIARSAVGTLTTVATTVSAISKAVSSSPVLPPIRR